MAGMGASGQSTGSVGQHVPLPALALSWCGQTDVNLNSTPTPLNAASCTVQEHHYHKASAYSQYSNHLRRVMPAARASEHQEYPSASLVMRRRMRHSWPRYPGAYELDPKCEPISGHTCASTVAPSSPYICSNSHNIPLWQDGTQERAAV